MSMRHVVCLALLVSGLPGAVSAAEAFEVRLGLTNGHLREVFFGCAEGATDDYDRDHDELAPPPGIGTGFTVFLPGQGNMPPFYKDIRPFGEKITWTFDAKVFEGKPVEVSWATAELPKEYDFVIGDAQGWEDMRATNSLAIPKSRTIQIVAEVAALSTGVVTERDAGPSGGSSGFRAEPEQKGTPGFVTLLRVVAVVAFVGVLFYAAFRRRAERGGSVPEKTDS